MLHQLRQDLLPCFYHADRGAGSCINISKIASAPLVCTVPALAQVRVKLHRIVSPDFARIGTATSEVLNVEQACGAWVLLGGLGALGCLTATWLASHNLLPIHLAALGRSGRLASETCARLSAACRNPMAIIKFVRHVSCILSFPCCCGLHGYR